MRNVERAKKIATEKGINVSFVCREIGKSRGYISQMLVSGRDFPDEMLPSVANALGVTVAELKGETLDKDPAQKEKPSIAEKIDLSGLSPEDAELVRKIMAASDAKKNAIRALL